MPRRPHMIRRHTVRRSAVVLFGSWSIRCVRFVMGLLLSEATMVGLFEFCEGIF
jgi:hypothetical protein